MSIATVFGFLFETQGAGKVTSELNKLNAVEKETEKSSDKLSDSSNDLRKKNEDLAKSVASLVSSYVGFKKILSEVLGFAKGGEDLSLMARNAGVGAEMLERYGIALQNYGGGLSSAASTLSSINQMIQDLRFGQDSQIKDAAIRYGLDISGSGEGGLATANELLEEIATRMETLNSQEQLDFGRRLGLDPSMISLMQTGVQNLNRELERASGLSIYNQEDLELSIKFQRALREFRIALDKVWGVISRAYMPLLSKLLSGVGKFVNYLSEKKGFVLGFFSVLGAALGVVAIKAAIAWAAILAPILPIIAGVTAIGVAIGLLVDDFIAFKEGGDSAIGYIYDLFYKLFNFLFDMAEKIGNVFGDLWDKLVAGFAGAFEWIFEKWEQMKSFIPFLGDDDVTFNKNIINKGREAIANTQTPLSTISNHVVGGSSTSVRIDKVDVMTQATDAKGISEQIGGTLRRELEMTVKQNSGGVLA